MLYPKEDRYYTKITHLELKHVLNDDSIKDIIFYKAFILHKHNVPFVQPNLKRTLKLTQ